MTITRTIMDMIMTTVMHTTMVRCTSPKKRKDTITVTAITMDMPTAPATSAA